MFNLSGSEIIFLLLMALVILGPDRLPDAMRRAGKAYAEFKKMTTGFQTEMRSALEEPMRELRETAELAKNAAMFDFNEGAASATVSAASAAATVADESPTKVGATIITTSGVARSAPALEIAAASTTGEVEAEEKPPVGPNFGSAAPRPTQPVETNPVETGATETTATETTATEAKAVERPLPTFAEPQFAARTFADPSGPASPPPFAPPLAPPSPSATANMAASSLAHDPTSDQVPAE